MNLLKKLFFFKTIAKQPTSLKWENTGSGLLFICEKPKLAFQSEDCLSTYQYLVLQQLLESGYAVKKGNGIHVPSEILCGLDETSREILGMPDAWPGRFELECHGKTIEHNFSLGLKPVEKWGALTYKPRKLEGPFLSINGKTYLPDNAQWLALSAVDKHGQLEDAKKTEAVNLAAIKAIQLAIKKGAKIDLKHFTDMDIMEPGSISVSAVENRDGSLRLIPSFGDSTSPEQIEKALGQLEGKSSEATLRLGKKIILFDERRLKAIHEILSTRIISAKDKHQFFKTPGAFLDAALVDLEVGFSLRVQGLTIFQKAYFGYEEHSGLNWFGNENDCPDVVYLNGCNFLIKNEEDLVQLKNLVFEAYDNSQSFVAFNGKTVLLPATRPEASKIIEGMYLHLNDKIQDNATNAEKKPIPSPTEQVTVKIDLHDTDLPDDLKMNIQGFSSYTGNIYKEDYKFKLFDYQEEGVRWIAGHFPSITRQEGKYFGGLLADDMGLGKTFMALTALNIFMRKSKKKKPILAVMPIVLLNNWGREISNVFNNSPFYDIVMLTAQGQLKNFRREGHTRENYYNGNEIQGNIRYSLKIGEIFGNSRLDMPDRLVLTNYDTLRDYQFSLCQVDWGCVIFDEAQEIKNPNTIKSRAARGLKADFRLALTGTPVENSFNDIWAIFDTVKPGLLGSFQEFRREFVKPVINIRDSSGENNNAIEIGNRLRLKIGPYMLRRTKEEKLSGLPKKIIHSGRSDKKYSVVMSGVQLEAYNGIISTIAHARQSGDNVKLRNLLLPCLRKLQIVSLHPLFLENGKPPFADSEESLQKYFKQSAKLELLINIIDEIKERDEKVIIFVINKSLQVFLSIFLGKKYGLPISIINGDTKAISSENSTSPDRIKLIQDFEAKKGFNIICMSPLAAGVGLTIVGANNVIHLERHWNPAKEAQATDRVYRIGAPKDVYVYFPILYHPTRKSFDVNLDELLQRKVELKNTIMISNELTPDDFNLDSVFGTEIINQRITPALLPSLEWKYFEALCAILAEKEWGGEAFLTRASGDSGADAIIVGNTNIIIQCKTSSYRFSKINSVVEPYYARPSYEKKANKKFNLLILAINAPSIDKRVYEKAKEYGVRIWDPYTLEKLILNNVIYFNDLDNMLSRAVLTV